MSATPDSSLANPEQLIADLRRQLAEREAELAECKAERDEALHRETATAEVLQVINSSPGDPAPVFDAMLEKAMRLCEATHGHVWRFDGEQLHAVSARGDTRFIEWLQDHSPIRPIPGSAADRVVRGERLVHLTDRREEEAYRDDPVFRGLVDTSGVRASVSVALRKDETLLGMINVYRQEVRSFTEKQIALLENFAAQAVIAMENARLITEAREALEQQTAAAEVLQVINSSPGDLAPVFEAILDKAHTLCGAALGSLFLYDGELFHAAATYGYPEDLAQRLRQGIVLFSTPQLLDDSVRWVHNPDLTLLDNPTARAVSGRGGVRTSLILPLRKDGRLLGAISCNRREVRPFADKQIALLQNFAAQAVIAMENARLLTETREALEQQTATAEVLQIINSSPGDLAPVFDAILEKAHTLCEAEKGSLNTYDGEHFQAVATHGLSPEYAAMLRAPQSKPPGSPPDRLLRGETIVQVPDASVLPFPIAQAATAIESVRTILYVPLRKETALLGYITVYRQEVRPFAEKQIALLQNFAAQAVIAMENARLLGELHQRTDEIAVEPRVRGAGSGAGRRVGPGRKIETVPCTATRRTDRLAGR